MPQQSLLNGVAAATTLRDRDDLDRAVVELLQHFIQPHSIALLRLVEGDKAPRLEERVRLSRAGVRAAQHADFSGWTRHAMGNEVVRCNGAAGHLATLFPIQSASGMLGLLVVESAAALPERLIDLVRGVLRIVRNHLAVLDYGEQDTLTGLLNRKRFDGHFDKLRQRISGAAANAAEPGPASGDLQLQEPSWLALVDIDHFKRINDGYGHLFGDEVLLLISQLMRRAFRGADQLFRFGGEEFIVILEHASSEGALLALERLRTSIEKYPFPQIGHVTVSLGYTQIKPQDVPTVCLARADAALYYAKGHGRNNVRNCEQLLLSGELSSDLKCGTVDLF
jgi:diguanylate cyclase (GGDEF)-like protein